MLKHRNQYDEEFRMNAVKLPYASSKTIKETAMDLGIAESLLYNWRKKYTASGDKTPVATLEEEVKNLLASSGIRQSFSRVGKPGDNAWGESFFANLKKEAVHWRHFRTREEARQKIFAYIEGFYNTKRAKERLGYLSPMQWLEQWNECRLKRVA